MCIFFYSRVSQKVRGKKLVEKIQSREKHKHEGILILFTILFAFLSFTSTCTSLLHFSATKTFYRTSNNISNHLHMKTKSPLTSHFAENNLPLRKLNSKYKHYQTMQQASKTFFFTTPLPSPDIY